MNYNSIMCTKFINESNSEITSPDICSLVLQTYSSVISCYTFMSFSLSINPNIISKLKSKRFETIKEDINRCSECVIHLCFVFHFMASTECQVSSSRIHVIVHYRLNGIRKWKEKKMIPHLAMLYTRIVEYIANTF
jgi:hypothetical protein